MGALCQVKWATGDGGAAAALYEHNRTPTSQQCEKDNVYGGNSAGPHLPFEVPEVPNLDSTLVPTRSKQIRGPPIPAHHVNVGFVRSCNLGGALPAFGSDIPYSDGPVGRARRKYRCFARGPLDVLYGLGMTSERRRGRDEGGLIGSGKKDPAVKITGEQAWSTPCSSHRRAPV